MKIGKIIKQIRVSQGLTQLQLAKNAGIGESYISMIELDKREPDIKVLEKICAALNIEVHDLMIDYILYCRKINPTSKEQITKLKIALNALIGQQ